MHTYSHALLTGAAARRSPGHTVAAVLGAVLPDAPVALGAAWLFVRSRSVFGREEFDATVCSRAVFRGPDAALHSVLPVGAVLAGDGAAGLSRGTAGAPLAFLLGWAGHVASDALTHSRDARPVLWPLSGRRFRSPVSYWDRDHHARAFSVLEHASLLPAVVVMLRHGAGERQRRRR